MVAGARLMPDSQKVWLCKSSDLVEGAEAVPFEVTYEAQSVRAFAIRFDGQAHAYLNRCSHVFMEMDYQPNRFLDISGRWLICATHGALYDPLTGDCCGGPCRGGLIKIALSEDYDGVHWHTAPHINSPKS
jgi:nitrite reductase/ring-hydroxylating ferredoxin subunit